MAIPTETEQLAIRAKRLKQVLWLIEIALLVLAGLVSQNGNPVVPISIALVMASLLGVHPLIRRNLLDWAATLLVAVLMTFIVAMMWTYGGLSDEVMLAFPALLVFSALLGNRKIFLGLLFFLIANVLAIGYFNDIGIIHNTPISSNSLSSIMIVIILLLVAFSIWILSNDLRNTLAQLESENSRVKRSEETIQRLVHHDSLTDLPNRVLAKDRFEHANFSAVRDRSKVCLLFMDLDKFKAINDSFGHSAGDQYLIEIANRLQATVRKTDTVCRQGGDEFLIILESVDSESQVISILEQILQAIRIPVKINDVSVSGTASIGIAISPDDGDDFETLCKKADMAMYHAKELGRNGYRFYNDEMEHNAEQSIRLLADMRSAIEKQQFELHYQPKIDLNSGLVIGAEALLRWYHPEKGPISPLDFIPLAESTGFINELGDWILEQACRDCYRWNQSGLQLTVAVNVSAVQLKRGNIRQQVSKALNLAQLPASFLELELTESTLIDNSEQQQQTLSALRAMGIDLSIDDFGTGYSNLGYLKNMQIAILKIDQSFVSRLLEDKQDKAIVAAVSQMAANLNLKTVAEGVEDEETAEALRFLNCDYGQGYLWSPAIPCDKFIDYAIAKNGIGKNPLSANPSSAV